MNRGYLYIIQEKLEVFEDGSYYPEEDRFKIGVTTNLNNRLSTLNTGNPRKLEYVHFQLHTNYRKAEKLLKKRLQKRHILNIREWICVDYETLKKEYDIVLFLLNNRALNKLCDNLDIASDYIGSRLAEYIKIISNKVGKMEDYDTDGYLYHVYKLLSKVDRFEGNMDNLRDEFNALLITLNLKKLVI